MPVLLLNGLHFDSITKWMVPVGPYMVLTVLNRVASVVLQFGNDPIGLQFGGDLIGLAILFLLLAVVAAVLGASGVAGISMSIAKWLVIIFVVLAVVTFIL